LRQIHTHVRRLRPDIIHCHSTKAGVLGRLARLSAFKTPLVYTPHCLAFDTALPLLQRRAARLMETLLAPLASHFIAVSHHEQRVITRSGLCRSERVSTIHNGVDLKAFDDLPRRSRADFGLQEDDFVIGCFGRLTRQKNQARLLRALPHVLKEVPRARLLLVGGGEDETLLRELARKLKIAARIHWTGEEEEARPFLGLCDMVAQPSRWEGCPYSVLEAMAARRAIVATPVGGVPELLRGVCATEPFARTTTDFATRIIHLAHDHAARAYIEHQVRGAVEDRFQLAQMIEKTRRVYESVL
jgi:glycosyltransferase involved in cell wall biosynthesis